MGGWFELVGNGMSNGFNHVEPTGGAPPEKGPKNKPPRKKTSSTTSRALVVLSPISSNDPRPSMGFPVVLKIERAVTEFF